MSENPKTTQASSEDRPKDTCLVYGKPASIKCIHCGEGSFCLDDDEIESMCNDAALDDGLHICRPHELTTADGLIKTFAMDMLPTDHDVRRDYGFNRCPNADTESILMSVYKVAIVTSNISAPEFNQWRVAGKLRENIHSRFTGSRRDLVPTDEFDWFLSNFDLFDNPTRIRSKVELPALTHSIINTPLFNPLNR
ncbi:hypothetical protein BX600DRAFT_442934 [Xylariales sp. PMI_506]|nr:hypothetical protein BX600DRAFT_442934 [Xylariales sp. PMI_506]